MTDWMKKWGKVLIFDSMKMKNVYLYFTPGTEKHFMDVYENVSQISPLLLSGLSALALMNLVNMQWHYRGIYFKEKFK